MSLLVRVIVVGAGSRGETYARYASVHPERMKVRCSWRFLEGKRALWSNYDVNINIPIQMNWSISLQVQFSLTHTIDCVPRMPLKHCGQANQHFDISSQTSRHSLFAGSVYYGNQLLKWGKGIEPFFSLRGFRFVFFLGGGDPRCHSIIPCLAGGNQDTQDTSHWIS